MNVKELLYIVANCGDVVQYATDRKGNVGYYSKSAAHYAIATNIVTVAIKKGLVAVVGNQLTLTSDGVRAYNPADMPAALSNRIFPGTGKCAKGC